MFLLLLLLLLLSTPRVGTWDCWHVGLYQDPDPDPDPDNSILVPARPVLFNLGCFPLLPFLLSTFI